MDVASVFGIPWGVMNLFSASAPVERPKRRTVTHGLPVAETERLLRDICVPIFVVRVRKLTGKPGLVQKRKLSLRYEGFHINDIGLTLSFRCAAGSISFHYPRWRKRKRTYDEFDLDQTSRRRIPQAVMPAVILSLGKFLRLVKRTHKTTAATVRHMFRARWPNLDTRWAVGRVLAFVGFTE